MTREVIRLFDNRLSPITSRIGFLRAPLSMVADGMAAWRREIHGTVRRNDLAGGLEATAGSLEPLTSAARPRELLVATSDPEWTALLDCGVQGGDPKPPTAQLARRLGVQGVVVVSIPPAATSGSGRRLWGARQLEMYAPIDTGAMNYVRTLSVTQDGKRWRFDADGTVQDFEQTERYTRRKITDRFTHEMLTDYAAELGLRPFADAFYPGPSVLLESPTPMPSSARVMSLAEARSWLGITAQTGPADQTGR